MGVPDFLKFVARSSPRALCRVPHTGTQSNLLRFDYVLVDATNVDLTISIDALLEFLKLPTITVRKAVIFALDSQRSREGTVRHHRQSHTMVGGLDVRVQRMCVSLTEHYRSRFQSETDENRRGCVPLVLVSGRSVAGEADYKIMDLHRTITAAHLLAQESTLPSFLFISEDSDVLCGALCGPAPHTVSIATNLRSTTFDLCILRVEHVLEYIADCVEAFKVENDPPSEVTSSAAALVQTAGPQSAPTAGGEAQDTLLARQHGEAMPPPGPEEENPRRRKKDGPNVATGVRIELTDSSSDDEADGTADTTITAPKPKKLSHREGAATSPGDPRNGVSLSQFCKEAGHIVGTTCVDLVLLFVLIMGNGANVPPLGRGVTKVDITSCWQAYCQKKYIGTTSEEKLMGRTLLDCSNSTAGLPASLMRDAPNKSQQLVSLSLDCGYLYSILRSVHYADDQSRSPVEEEKSAARVFLSNAIYVTLRYLIGCNLEGGATITETFLDSRPLLEAETMTPNLAAVLWVLGQQQRMSFQFLLSGSTIKNLNADPALDGHGPVVGAHTDKKAASASSPLQLDVREALVSPAPASSWAVRGAGSRNYSLKVAMSNRKDPILFSSIPSEDGRGISVASLLQQYAIHHVDTVKTTGGNRNTPIPVFDALITVWRRSVMMAIPHLQKLSSASSLAGSGSAVKHVEPLTYVSPLADVAEGATDATNPEQAISRKRATPNNVEEEDSVYSFELRRMVPVLGNTHSHLHASENALIKGLPSSSAEKQAALCSALGISFDYARQDLAVSVPNPELASSRIPKGWEDGDDAERTRVRKIPRKERSRKNLNESKVKTFKAHQGSSSTSVEQPVKKSKMRPGKRERRKMARQYQVANPGKKD